jgi:hypothetical protein
MNDARIECGPPSALREGSASAAKVTFVNRALISLTLVSKCPGATRNDAI